jgi:hypothetical protein
MPRGRFAIRTIVFTALVAAGALGVRPAHAEGLFAHYTGTWSGNGTISFNSGARERIRCRANYTSSNDANALRLELRCASDSYKFELQSDLAATGNSISGTWREVTRKVAGNLSGRGAGDRIDVTAISPTFSAFLTMVSRNNRQNITIQSPGSEMQEVAIALARSGRH